MICMFDMMDRKQFSKDHCWFLNKILEKKILLPQKNDYSIGKFIKNAFRPLFSRNYENSWNLFDKKNTFSDYVNDYKLTFPFQ